MYIYIYIHIFTYICIYVYIHIHIHISFILKNSCIHKYIIYIYTYTCTHTYSQKAQTNSFSKDFAKNSQNSSALSFPSKLKTSWLLRNSTRGVEQVDVEEGEECDDKAALWSESCHKYEWVMPHIWMRHVTYMNASCHKNAWGKWIVLGQSCPILSRELCRACMNESFYTYAWGRSRVRWWGRRIKCIMSHMWVSHVTYINQSFHTYEWVVSHKYIRHVAHLNESCKTCERVKSHNESCQTCEGVKSHIWMRHVTHMNESCHTYEWVTSHVWWVTSYISMSHVTGLHRRPVLGGGSSLLLFMRLVE